MKMYSAVLIDNTGKTPLDKSLEERINECALRYYNSTDVDEKTRLLECATTIFSNSRYYIANSGLLKKYYDKFGDPIVSDITYIFFQMFIKYKPHPKSEDEFQPFFPYFRKYAPKQLNKVYVLFKTIAELTLAIEDEDNDGETKCIEIPTPDNSNDVIEKMSFAQNFAYLMVKLEDHRKNEKRKRAFHMFYTGDTIAAVKSNTDIIRYFKANNYERKILSSCDEEFFDYVFTDKISGLDSVMVTSLKKYRDMIPLPNTAKSERAVELPIHNFVYAAYTSSTEANISQLHKKYNSKWHEEMKI